jgi:hypothetical protein
VLLDVFTGQTTTDTGAFNGSSIQVVLGKQATDRRAERVVALLFQSWPADAGQA